ncbi:MAG TPA: gliding motility lipoprotein GldH [Saprospiraceae bacterium]|nr:gliding motility lipoprotein GldH [Saprospiraceae bacterium]
MSFRSTVLLLLCLFSFTACQDSFIYDQAVEPSGNTWTYDQALNFDFNVQDTSLRYEFLLDIKHSHDYPFQNLYTRITTVFPDDTEQQDIVSLELANKLGLWEGKCRGDFCALTIALQERARFDTPGDYQLRFEQYSRQDSLPGLEEFRLRIALKE